MRISRSRPLGLQGPPAALALTLSPGKKIADIGEQRLGRCGGFGHDDIMAIPEGIETRPAVQDRQRHGF